MVQKNLGSPENFILGNFLGFLSPGIVATYNLLIFFDNERLLYFQSFDRFWLPDTKVDSVHFLLLSF
jgi:hypothetical protein